MDNVCKYTVFFWALPLSALHTVRQDISNLAEDAQEMKVNTETNLEKANKYTDNAVREYKEELSRL